MTLKINHSFVSAKPVGTDSSRIYSDSWNADHTITGQADGSQLNPNVVQAVVSDTNVTGAIASQTLTLSWSGTLSAARGGFGINISAQSGVPLFATGVPTFVGTTGTGSFVQATSPTITTPTISGLETQAVGSDTAQFTLVTGLGGNGRLIGSLESSNVKLRSQNSVTLSLGVNSSDVFTVSATGATLSQPLTYGGVTLTNAVTGTGAMVLATSPSLTTPVIGSGGLTLTGTVSGTQVLRGPSAASGTITTPAGTYSIVGDTLAQTLFSKTLSGPTVTSSGITINGATSGSTVIQALALAGGTLTLPAAIDTLVARATTDTLTNKTINGPSNTITNVGLGSLATQAAYTLVGNFTNSSAAPTASAIGGLTQKASPAGTDLIIIQDQAASGQLKYATVSSVASAGSVSSIGSLTGAFTIDGGNLASNVLPFPRNDAAQSWSTALQKQVRQNIGADSGVFIADRNGTNQTGLTAGANNKISFNNKVKDANSWFDAVTNFRYTPLIAGTYLVALNVASTNGTSGETCQALLFKNGSSVKIGPYMSVSSGAAYQSQVVAAIPMNGSTDYLEFYVYLPATITTLNGATTTTNVQAYRIGD